MIGSKIQVFKKEKVHYFFFFKNINDSIHRFLKNAVCIRSFNVNYSNINHSCLPPPVLLKYGLHKYVNTFKVRSQTSVNKHNPTCEMLWDTLSYCNRFYVAGDLTNIYSFIKFSLEWPFSELFFFDITFWNQYKHIAFNIFSSRILATS